MSQASVAFRLARRGTALSLRHALLILLVIALPIAGMSALLLWFQSGIPTTTETVTNQLGRTQTMLTVVRSPDPTARQDRLDILNLNGRVDGKGNLLHPDTGAVVDPRTLLPAGATVLTTADSSAQVQGPRSSITLPVTLGETADPSLRGRFDLVSGRAPHGTTQITATQAALDRLGATVGSRVSVTSPVIETFTVTGVLADHRYPASRATLFLPADAYHGTAAQPGLRDTSFFLPATDITWAQSARFNHQGITVWSRALVTELGPPQSDWALNSGVYLSYLAFIAALAAFIVALLAGSAFSIGARARQRALAVVAATGASRGLVFGLLVSTGALIGAVAGVVGVAVGVGAGAVLMSATADGTLQRYAGFHLLWWQQVIVFGYAVLVGAIAAAVPAFGASRADTVAALRGTRRPAPPNRKRPVVGAAMVIVGAVLSVACGAATSFLTTHPFYADHPDWIGQHYQTLQAASGYGLAAGIIVTQLGLLLCAGVVVRWAARMISRAGISAHLAGRDLSRNSARTVPAIGAIMATSFLAVLAAGLLTSEAATNTSSYTYSLEPGQLYVPATTPNGTTIDATKAIDAITAAVNVRSATAISGAPQSLDFSPDDTTLYASAVLPASQACPPTTDGQPPNISFNAHDPRCRDPHANGVMFADVPGIVVGDSGTLAAVLGHAPSPQAVRELAAGGAVALHEQLVAHGTLMIGWKTVEDQESTSNTAARAKHISTVDAVFEKADQEADVLAVLSPQAAARAGIRPVPSGLLIQVEGGAKQARLDAIDGVLQRMTGDPQAGGLYEPGPNPDSEQPYVLAALLASSFLALCAAGVALALARSDGRQDADVLSSVGATGGIRRRYAAWQAVIITGVGMLLGTVTGTIGVYAIDGTSSLSLFVMPWVAIVVAVVGTTTVMTLLSWTTGGRARALAFRSAIA